MTTIVDITQLNGGVNGTVKATDVYPAVDVTDTTQAPTGTTKRYSIAQLATFIGGGGLGGLTWNTVTATTQQIVNQNGYIPTNAGLTTFTLPATAAIGQSFQIRGLSTSGGWTVVPNALQTMFVANSPCTTGVLGSVSSLLPTDGIEAICIVANLTWALIPVGNLTIV